jgi:hypothetical protein|tara:strand:- start:301 stop:930 length:630 start_codon:yes stop_codon:yes gene_type:complete
MRISNTALHKEPYFLDATEDIATLKDSSCVDLFDQNGYHLTKAEQAFLSRNGYEKIARRHEDCLRQDWIKWDKKEGAHINHSDIFERKGFADQALEQLLTIAEEYNPMLYKLVKMKPKWGIDISIDYVSKDAVFEVFHYEWDSFNYEELVEKKYEIENLVLKLDWDTVALELWNVKEEWINLDFFDQTKWRTDYFDLSPEKFKNAIWES